MSNSYVDRSKTDWPREVTDAHIAADGHHTPVPHSNYGDDIYDTCGECGLSITSDGKRHGWDAI